MSKSLEFRGHSWLKVTGDALTPPRFWDYQLLTESEYNARSECDRVGFKQITDDDLPRLENIFK